MRVLSAVLALSLLAGAAYVVKLGLAAIPEQVAKVKAGPQRCVFDNPQADGKDVTLELDQAANAATIAAVGLKMGYGQQAVTVALATAMQESGLRNLAHGDRDSQGLFQQRPSQGWGTSAQVRDPVHASGRFFSRLGKVPQWSALPVTEAAQAVQRSGFPSAYAKHASKAGVLAAVLTGTRQAAMSCRFTVTSPGAQTLGPSGLTGRAAAVRTEVTAAFGRTPMGGFQPGGVSTGHMAGSAHYEGRAVDVFFRPVDEARQRRGWATAQWAVANAHRLRIRTVIFDGRIWTAARSAQGWRTYVAPAGSAGDPDVLNHLDHVHIDVA